ncbi:uncharacterized protein [Trachinotus anak]|uniref:uncharacterized protein isoform X4 n=1 Tax=Trachinotus anak TaxID=443729 RepID=UPI0039F218AB
MKAVWKMVRTWLYVDATSKLKFGGTKQWTGTSSSSCFLTTMGGWTLVFVLLLPPTVYFDSKVLGSEVTLEKTLGSKPDVTPLCTNETLNIITLIVCKIDTQRSRGEECGLLYRHGQDFENKCDSKFTLKTENQTVFLHLTSLTPEDSGNYTCECSRSDGTYILLLNVTVKDSEEEGGSFSKGWLILAVLIALNTVIIITGVILGLIHRRIHHRGQPQPQSSQNQEPQDIEPYSTFMQKKCGLYSTVTVHSSNGNANNSNMFTREVTGSGNYVQPLQKM